MAVMRDVRSRVLLLLLLLLLQVELARLGLGEQVRVEDGLVDAVCKQIVLYFKSQNRQIFP